MWVDDNPADFAKSSWDKAGLGLAGDDVVETTVANVIGPAVAANDPVANAVEHVSELIELLQLRVVLAVLGEQRLDLLHHLPGVGEGPGSSAGFWLAATILREVKFQGKLQVDCSGKSNMSLCHFEKTIRAPDGRCCGRGAGAGRAASPCA